MAEVCVQAVPCLRDNYAYLVRCEETGHVAVVDPSEAEPVQAALEGFGGVLKAIWNTHHHWDHVGGNDGLLEMRPALRVVGHESDRGRIPGQTDFVKDGEIVSLGKLKASIRHVPAHTTGAIAYFVGDEVFTGDTLFLAGCGRLFEGTPEMMFKSLAHFGAHCKPESRLWVGHEYTSSNLRFAHAAEPNNSAVKYALEQSEQQAQTVPGTWAQELAVNPFVRAETVEDLARLRAWKDTF